MSWDFRKVSKARLSALVALISATFLFTACGGDGVSGNQQTDPVTLDFPILYVQKSLVEAVPEPAEGEEPDPNAVAVVTSNHLLDLLEFNPTSNPRLYIRDQATPTAPETELLVSFITAEFGADAQFDIGRISINFDATKIVFSLRALTAAQAALEEAESEETELEETEQPTWNLWEYTIATNTFNRVMQSDGVAEAGNDITPAYLEDGTIVFTSDRQARTSAIQLDEGKGQYKVLTDAVAPNETEVTTVFNLHTFDVENPTGTPEQITFNRGYDFDPAVLSNGKVVFSRWDTTSGIDQGISYYQMNFNGSQVERLYGYHSHDTGEDPTTSVHFTRAIPMPSDSTGSVEILTLLRPYSLQYRGTDLVRINVKNFVEHDVAVTATSNGDGSNNNGQTSATSLDVSMDDVPSLGGKYSAAYPLFDGTNRAFVSWAFCEVETAVEGEDAVCDETLFADGTDGLTPAMPTYGIYIYDFETETQRIIKVGEKGNYYSDIVAAQPIDKPLATVSDSFQPALKERKAAILNIRSIYDLDGTFGLTGETPEGETFANFADPTQYSLADRNIRFLRFMKRVTFPDEEEFEVNNVATQNNDRAAAGEMWELLGYAPVMPDGSVRVLLPAEIPFTFFYVDANGEEINSGTNEAFNSGQEHFTWLELLPGEEKVCSGCHVDGDSQVAHGRSDAQVTSINTGAPFANTQSATQATAPVDTCRESSNELCEGDTMAEIYTKLDPSRLDRTFSLYFEDIFTPSGTTAVPSIDISYEDLTTPAPSRSGCASEWDGLCRGVINYEDHIHPIWSADRIDAAAATVTCVGCHAREVGGISQDPKGSLELTGGYLEDEEDFIISHQELIQGSGNCSVNALTNLALPVVRRTTLANENLSPTTGSSLFTFDASSPPPEDPIEDVDAVTPPVMTVTDTIIDARNCECVHQAVNSDACEIDDDNGDGFTNTNITPGITYSFDLDNNPDTPNETFNFTNIYGFDSNNRAIVDWAGTEALFINPDTGLLVRGFDQGQNAILDVELDGRTIIGYQTDDLGVTTPIYGDTQLDYFYYSDRRAISFNIVVPDDFIPGNRMTRGNSSANSDFLDMMISDTYQSADAPADYDHTGLLTDSELLLLREWFDVGMQYYNNPFHPALQTED